jgi:S1-C subfamily serine protease
LDETRNRFVYPQDRTLVVYFEFDASPGDHVLTATWKMPDGRVSSVSPDVKILTSTQELNCYWIFDITPSSPNGPWTVEIRIDGQPAGSHAFELAGLDPTNSRFTLDRVFKTYGPSLVRIYRVDESGRRDDPSRGFVIRTNTVATAFQSIDSATGLDVEFADGRRVRADEVLGVSRLGDWALIRVETAGIVPIPRSESSSVSIGVQLCAFMSDGGTQVLVPVTVGGISVIPSYGGRIRFSPSLSEDALGGPLIDDRGQVVAIVGGSVTPGLRAKRVYRAGTLPLTTTGAATMLSELPTAAPSSGKSFAKLWAESLFTPTLVSMPEVTAGGTTKRLPNNPSEGAIEDAMEFSARDDGSVSVYTFWTRQGKLSKGEVAGGLFDAANRTIAIVPAKKISLGSSAQRYSFSVAIKSLPPGYYRIDVMWDRKPAWRSYIRVLE